MKEIIAMVLAGGQSHPSNILARTRATASIPFGGKYRIIDFALSNCVNSEIYTVGVLAQYAPYSLMDHIGVGKPWDLDRQNGGVSVLQPYLSTADTGWFRGTADALLQNQDYIQNHNPKYTLILSGDHVYKMDYRKMLEFHIKNNAPVTVAYTQVSKKYARKCGVVQVDEKNKVVGLEEKPAQPKSDTVNMGIYLFDTEVLLYKLQRIGRENRFDIVFHMMMDMIGMGEVYGYKFEGYWRDIGTLNDYWLSNMDMIDHPEHLNLYKTDWIIHTVSERKPPVRFNQFATSINSMIANGCTINGFVEHSILFPGVRVGRRARIINSIVMHRSVINDGACLNHTILDKDVWVGADSQIGWESPMEEDMTKTSFKENILTVVGKGAIIPANVHIGQNCTIEPFVKETDFLKTEIPSGSFVTQRG
jgi:glucose-1-phosphate adenylyltransferase